MKTVPPVKELSKQEIKDWSQGKDLNSYFEQKNPAKFWDDFITKEIKRIVNFKQKKEEEKK